MGFEGDILTIEHEANRVQAVVDMRLVVRQPRLAQEHIVLQVGQHNKGDFLVVHTHMQPCTDLLAKLLHCTIGYCDHHGRRQGHCT